MEWERGGRQVYPVGIKIEAWDRTGLLRDIAAVIAESKINLSGADVQVYDDKTAVISTIVEIQNLTQLSRLLERLEGVRDVHTVARDGRAETRRGAARRRPCSRAPVHSAPMAPIPPPRGTRDLLPAEAPAWAVAASRPTPPWRSRMATSCIDTPVFEATELFARGVGAGTDIVDKEMYTFTDRGGRSLTLRPEGTAPGAARGARRATSSSGSGRSGCTTRWPMFRYDRPQAGRQRQFPRSASRCIGERDPSSTSR